MIVQRESHNLVLTRPPVCMNKLLIEFGKMKPAGSRGSGGLGDLLRDATRRLDGGEDAVERLARTKRGIGLGLVREIVAANINGLALDR